MKITDVSIAADKERTRELFKRWDALQEDPRQYDEGAGMTDKESPYMKWLEDGDPIFYGIIRLYIRHVATEDWIFNSVTMNSKADSLMDSPKGERKVFDELREWAEL